MTNRILVAIDRTEKLIAAKALPKDKLTELSQKLNMGLSEWSVLQDKKSLAAINGTITNDEANTIYGLLGGSPESFAKRTLAEKIVLTQVATELLAA